MRDIAQACGVVAGLCYRYFDSKQKLFQEATEAYVEECCGLMRRTLGDETLSLSQKLDRLYGTMGEEADFRYHGFFHRAGNEDFHQQLSLRLCQRMAPLLVSRSTCSAPKKARIWLSAPWAEGSRKDFQIPAITTQERKWGR